MSYRYLAKIFSRPFVDRIARGGSLNELTLAFAAARMGEVLDTAACLRDAFEAAYCTLMNHHRSEYVYKNAIANKILLGRHSLKSAALLTEFRAGTSKADIVLVNGTSSVYEIKSEFDSVERLQTQLVSYCDIFDRIYVCSHKSQLAKLERALPSNVGIVLLSEQYTLQTVREAQSNKANVKPSMIFHSLRKHEYTNIVRQEFGAVSEVPATKYYSTYHALFSQLAPERAHDAMVTALRERIHAERLAEFIERVPQSLRAASLYTPLNAVQRQVLLGRLDRSAALA